MKNEQIIESIKAMKRGVIDAAGVEKGEKFIGRNIEVIIESLLAGKDEVDTLVLCDFNW